MSKKKKMPEKYTVIAKPSKPKITKKWVESMMGGSPGIEQRIKLLEKIAELQQRTSYLEDCLRDAGYKSCTDECGEFWVKE